MASYDFRCAHGASAIFSLSFAEVRQVTVEVEPRSRRIVRSSTLEIARKRPAGADDRIHP